MSAGPDLLRVGICSYGHAIRSSIDVVRRGRRRACLRCYCIAQDESEAVRLAAARALADEVDRIDRERRRLKPRVRRAS